MFTSAISHLLLNCCAGHLHCSNTIGHYGTTDGNSQETMVDVHGNAEGLGWSASG